jgi:hypothetical protein
MTAAQTVYKHDGKNHIYYRIDGSWYDLATNENMETPIDASTINRLLDSGGAAVGIGSTEMERSSIRT